MPACRHQNLLFLSKNLAGGLAYFLRTQFCKHQKPAFALSAFFLISTMDFEKAISYFSTSNPAFSQADVLHVRASFSPVETSFTALSLRSLRNKFLFRYMPSQKAITPASLDTKRGVLFCIAKNMTLFVVKWMRLLCILTTKSSTYFHLKFEFLSYNLYTQSRQTKKPLKMLF